MEDRLRMSREDAKKEINKLIVDGQLYREDVEREYRAIRQAGQAIDVTHIEVWKAKGSAWDFHAYKVLEHIFPTQKEANAFKSAQPLPFARVGESHRWSTLDNGIRAKLEQLERIYQSIDAYRSAKNETPSVASRLAIAFEKYSDADELELLCGALGTSLDKITDKVKLRLMALRVFQYFEQRDRMVEVLVQLERDRPDVNWHRCSLNDVDQM